LRFFFFPAIDAHPWKTGKSAKIGANTHFSLTAQTQQFQWFSASSPVQRRCISFTLVWLKQQGDICINARQ